MMAIMAAALALLLATAIWGLRQHRPRGHPLGADTAAHYRRMYSRRNFLKLGAAVAGAAVLVYSGADEAVETWHHSKVQGETSDRAAKFLHHFGERWWFAVWGAFALVDRFVTSTAVSRWGRETFQAMVVGLPTLWSVQRGLGGARPSDATHGPRFVPFADDNAASGHCFLAAIPCLVAARRLGSVPARNLAYATSPLVGWSRINDHKHYLSQVLLGYGIAWQAVDTVVAVDDQLHPAPAPGTISPRE